MIRPPDDTLPTAANEAAPTSASLKGERLVIRADADSRIGMGHVMRCLALAQSWIGFGGTARLACTAVPPVLSERYHDAGAEVVLHDRWPPDELMDAADAVVIDGLHIPDGDLASIADAGVPLAIVDDMGHRPAYPASLIVNQNLHARADLYAGKTEGRLCLGPTYGLLRQEFRGKKQVSRTIPQTASRLLILMGGADPKGYSAQVLEAVAKAAEEIPGEPEVILVVGAANPALGDLAQRASLLPVRIDLRHDVRDMAGLLASVDLAVSAAGSTVLEMACLGVPMIIGAQNDSETGPAAALDRAGAAIDIGPLATLDPAALARTVSAVARDPVRRRDLSENAQRHVDGRGADRVAALIAGLVRPHAFKS